MFTDLFEQRDKTLTHLIKLGDCMGRSLRQNVSLFSVDSHHNTASFVTEEGKVITGSFHISDDVVLEGIKVQDSEVFNDEEQFNGFVNEKINSFIGSIHYGEFSQADASFDDVLSLWNNRLRLNNVQNRLAEQSERLEGIENIIESEEFQNVMEVTPQILDFLSENFDKIISVPEIRNAVNLSNTVSQAFNFPRMSFEELSEQGVYTIKNGVNNSIYDMICRQELVKKELQESKKNFQTVWAHNSAIQNLASMVFESDEAVVAALSEAIKEVPYITLASKKALFETFSNCLASADGIGVSEKDIQSFASRIFEYKKDVKEVFIQSLNEKYGVNVQNLQDPASFKSLANTQVVIFETLSRLTPKGSILRKVLSEMGQSLKGKSGVECIDVNDYLLECFIRVGLDNILQEEEVELRKSDFRRISEDVSDLEDILETLRQRVQVEEEVVDEAVDQETFDAAAETMAQEMEQEDALEQEKEEEEAEKAADDLPVDSDEFKPDSESEEEVLERMSKLEKAMEQVADEVAASEEEEKEG